MADGGALVPNITSSTNLPKQHLNRWEIIIHTYNVYLLFYN